MYCFYVKRSISLKVEYSKFSFNTQAGVKRSKQNFQQHERASCTCH